MVRKWVNASWLRPNRIANNTRIIPSITMNLRTWEVTSKRVVSWTTNRWKKNYGKIASK